MDTAVREQVRTQAIPNGRVRMLSLETEPSMTWEARTQRTIWRKDNLATWQSYLESLSHYDPGHAYDIAHEYFDDWTTDPNYGADGVHLLEFDEDGVFYPPDERAHTIEQYMCDTARDLVGNRVAFQGFYRFVDEIAVELKRYTEQGKPANTVKPDLTVMPSEEDLDVSRLPEDRRPRPDDPVPELVLEILSESTAAQDLDDKLRLYQTLGIREYLVYDLGGKRWPGSPRELWLYRLEDGVYREIPADPKLSTPDAQAFPSEVFNATIRMLPDPRENDAEMQNLPERRRPAPLFQWYDEDRGTWRDHASDKLREQEDRGITIGRAEERVEQAISVLRTFLEDELAPTDLDRIEETWRTFGPPANYAQRVRTVLQEPGKWQSLLELPPDGHNGSRRPQGG